MKQDRNGVRTAQDLERKYDLSSIGTLKRNYELQKTSLNKVENELNNFVSATTQNIEELQNQVDGNITTWFSSGIPTINNYPASEWEDDDTRNNHLGDLYYDRETGYAYRFTLEENTYQWIDIKDTDVTQALALANAAQDTADSKRRVFVVQPSPPYDVGDLWLRNEELYRCQITKGENELYAERDWIKATKYTDDTVAYQVDGKLTILSGTVTEIKDNVDELSTTMTNTTRLVNEQGETIGTLQEQQSSTKQTVNEISATVSSHGNKITSLEQTVEVFSVDLDIYNITIPVDTNNKPLENKTYQIGYYAYYKGSQVSPSVSSQSSATGISQNISNNKINLSVSTSTAISNLTNELIYQFSYTADGETHNVTKKIIVVISQKGEQGIQGIQGQPGIPGQPGADGTSTYFYVRYSANSSGSPMTTAPQSDTQYMGVASTTSSTAPTSPSAYTWSKTKGEQGIQGIQGQAGQDGKSSYLHIKYSEDGTTFTPAKDGYALGEKPSRWQGTYVDFNATDSTTFSDYDWVDTAIMVEDLLTPTNNASGTSITTTDSADADLLYLELEGKTTQETRSGKNLLGIPNVNYSGYGITIESTNGAITISGTATETLVYDFNLISLISSSLGTLTKSLNASGTFSGLQTSLRNNGGNSVGLWSDNAKSSTNTISADAYKFRIQINSGITINATIKPQIEVGSSATSWEQGGAMPSPQYPSELVSVGYENLFDKDGNQILEAFINGSTGVITNYNATRMLYIECKSNTTYTFSRIGGTRLIIGTTNVIPTNGIIVNDIVTDNSATVKTYTTNTNAKYLCVFYYNSGSDTLTEENIRNSIQITKDTQARSYIPYGKYGIEVKTTGKNLLNATKYSSGNYVSQLLTLKATTYTVSFEGENANGIYVRKADGTLPITGTTVVVTYEKKQYTFTLAEEGQYYIQFYKANPGWASFSNAQLEKGSIATNYEEYKSNTYLYILDNPLRSIGDIKDLLYIKNGMLYVDRKIGSIVLDGSETYSNQDGAYDTETRMMFSVRINSISTDMNNRKGMANYFVNSTRTMQDRYADITAFNFHSQAQYSNYIYFKIEKSLLPTQDSTGFANWVSTHNIEVQYELGELYTEELGKVRIPSTYKGITHIDTTDELEPNMSIIYVRNLPLTNYVESHYTELKIKEDGIETRVESIENNGYGDRISAVETKQTSTDLKVNVISTNSGIELDYDSEGKPISGKVREVTTTTGFTFNAEGMTIEDTSSNFKAQHRNTGTYYKDGDTIVGQYTKDGSKQKDLELFGVYYYGKNNLPDTPMFIAQLYTDENGEECFGHFYNRGD